jgi:hypothetical protein
MEKNRKLYWLFASLVLAEVLNLVFKVANPYYFNLIILTVLTVLTALLGKSLGIKIGWIVTLTVLTLLLIGLLSFVVWN